MDKENKENLSNKEKSPKEWGDINGQERIKQEKDIREEIGIREEVASSLDELKAKIEPPKDYLDMLYASKSKNKNSQFQSSKKKWADLSALSSNYFDTREKSDVWKGVFSAVFDSAVVFWWVILDLWKDALQLAAHPISTTQESIVLYKKQDPNTKAI